jgi:Cu(I)/Ag(I) efflux system membrane fusion protein
MITNRRGSNLGWMGIAAGAALAAVLALGGWALYEAGARHGAGASAMQTQVVAAAAPAAGGGAPAKAGDVDPVSGRRVLYWRDPMVPGRRFDHPGKSPFMDMALVPVYADVEGDQGQASVSPRMQQSLGVRTVEVARGTLVSRLQAAGSIAFNERDQAVVQARATAYVERLYVRATLDRVARGQALVDLYVPDWVAAQEEFLALKRAAPAAPADLIDAARQRMRQAGMGDAQIDRVEAGGKVQPRITLEAPIGGVLVELLAREGMTVAPGATLFRINGLSTVWANAEVPESQAALVHVGSFVEARSPALPGAVFKGRVQAILPDVNQSTRTLKARLELANPASNPARQLVPGMFVSVELKSPGRSALLVPSEAVIETGTRTVVMLAERGGRFRPVDVQIGAESEGQTEIRSGLQAGQKVVASGQFLVDSEANLNATAARMTGVAATAGASENSR